MGQVNRATAETSQQRGVDEGLIPLQRYVAGVINRIIAKDFTSPDLEFAWQDTTTPDPLEAANIDVAYVTAGIKTVDEVRESLGLPKLQKPLQVAKFNPYHLPAGSSDGGQFCSADEAGQGGSSANAPYDDTNDRADRSYPELAIIGLEAAAEEVAVAAGARAISAVRTINNLIETTAPTTNIGRTAVDETETAEAAASTAARTQEVDALVEQATGLKGNDGAVASSRDVAEDAAKKFVGDDSFPMENRNTNEYIGERNLDKTRMVRYTSADKSDPYINLEDKTTGGNLHVRWKQ